MVDDGVGSVGEFSEVKGRGGDGARDEDVERAWWNVSAWSFTVDELRSDLVGLDDGNNDFCRWRRTEMTSVALHHALDDRGCQGLDLAGEVPSWVFISVRGREDVSEDCGSLWWCSSTAKFVENKSKRVGRGSCLARERTGWNREEMPSTLLV